MDATLKTLDIGIVGVYFLLLIGKSIFLSRRAAKGVEHYFLGGRTMPWWALGASGMSSNLDIAGTVTIISLVYMYGIHGFFIEMRGGVVLPIAVFLAFMGKWHRRSNVVTTGEWMGLRFGQGWQSTAARFTAVATYVIITVSMVVFFLVATGQFLPKIVPLDATTCRLGMAGVMLLYTMISGLYGVVWTDVLQAGVLGVVAIYLTVLAFGYVTPEIVEPWPGARYNTAVPIIADGLSLATQPEDSASLFFPFGLFLLFWVGKGVLEGLGGSGGSAYMAQRFYAAKDDRTVKKLCMFWTVLFAFRWPMVLAFVVLAVHLGVSPENSGDILPLVLTSGLIPSGMLGVVLVAILAASMSTFDSTINAGAGYLVRDVYLVARPKASEKAQVRAGYAASAGLVLVGVGVSALLTFENQLSGNAVLTIWRTIVVQLFPAFLVPFALRWFWDRFNGAGFTAGVAAGFGASLILVFVPDFDPTVQIAPWIEKGELTDVAFLGGVGLLSLLGCLAGTWLTPPTSPKSLKMFYEQIRPFGKWPREWKTAHTKEHRIDLFRLGTALVWQVSTFMLPMVAFLRMWPQTIGVAVIWMITGGWLFRDINKTGGQ